MRALGGESEKVVVWESLDSGGFPWSEHPQPGWVEESAATGGNEAGGQWWCWFVGVHPAEDRCVTSPFNYLFNDLSVLFPNFPNFTGPV